VRDARDELEKKTETRTRQLGDAVIIDLMGDVTNRGQQAIQRAYDEALACNPQRVFINFGGTEYINTSGIAILISLVMEGERSGHKIGLFGMSPHYRKVFTLVRLPLYANIYESEDEALASM
jgi:anti-anti-sigma factor